MEPKVIQNEEQYEVALLALEELWDAEDGSREAEHADVWAVLVRDYESKHYAIEAPDPISAIKFRMEQQNLKQVDLVPYIGSASKVSEVLSGKRSLSLAMIRALNENLGIPAESLLAESKRAVPAAIAGVEWERFPISAMFGRGWFEGFSGGLRELRQQAEERIRGMVPNFDLLQLQPAMLRAHVRSGSTLDEYALWAWQLRTHALCDREDLPEYRPGTLSDGFIRDVVRLSTLKEGPVLAREFLNKYGIHLVVEQHLPRTHLDGAAFWHKGRPVVALSLRHDRLDNFWFTLAHELAHLVLHVPEDSVDVFVDDLENASTDSKEAEADALAQECLIPKAEWEGWFYLPRPRTVEVVDFAERLRVHPSIVAGRVRYEISNFMIFNPLVRDGSPREALGVQ